MQRTFNSAVSAALATYFTIAAYLCEMEIIPQAGIPYVNVRYDHDVMS